MAACVRSKAPLPPSYVIFGRVTSGMEAVDAIAETPTRDAFAKCCDLAGGLQARPREYERRVVGFFDRSLAR